MSNDLRGTVLILDTPDPGFVTNGVDSTRGTLNSDVFYNQIIWSGFVGDGESVVLTDAKGISIFAFISGNGQQEYKIDLGGANQRAVGGIKMPTLTSGIVRIYQL
jgi:hypothetical protein